MRPRLAARAVLGLALALAPLAAPAVAAEWERSRPGDGATRSFERETARRTPADPARADDGSVARARMDAQQRSWDRAMKAVGTGICSGC